jgi:hypothetical protein
LTTPTPCPALLLWQQTDLLAGPCRANTTAQQCSSDSRAVEKNRTNNRAMPVTMVYHPVHGDVYHSVHKVCATAHFVCVPT